MIMNQIVSGEGGGGLDTYDATAYPEHILKDYTAYARGAKITGTYVGTIIYDTPGEYELTLFKGKYYLDLYGAQGGYRSSIGYGGKGGRTQCYLELAEPTFIWIRVGGAGNNGGYNGGGTRQGTYSTKQGGGASDIRLLVNSLYSRIAVAGGGGSDGAANKPGKGGGGLTGNSATENYGTGGQGGTQTAGGAGGSNTLTAGTFGQGGTGINASNGHAGAGGGGWYGGAGSQPDGSGDDDRGGGGGSGYAHTIDAFEPSGYLLAGTHYVTDVAFETGVREGDGLVSIMQVP